MGLTLNQLVPEQQTTAYMLMLLALLPTTVCIREEGQIISTATSALAPPHRTTSQRCTLPRSPHWSFLVQRLVHGQWDMMFLTIDFQSQAQQLSVQRIDW